MHAALAELQGNGAIIARLAAALGQPIKRGPGRPRKSAILTTPSKRSCAVIDCGNPARSKGYCASHYRKFRMLKRTRRLPSDWVADAAPGTVANVALPRGRAGSKALAEGRRK